MGNNEVKSVVTNITKNNTITTNAVNSFSKTFNKSTTSIMTNIKSSCKTTPLDTEKIMNGNITASGPGTDITLSLLQSQNIIVYSKCNINATQTTNIQGDIVTQLSQLLSSENYQKILSAMKSRMDQNLKQGLINTIGNQETKLFQKTENDTTTKTSNTYSIKNFLTNIVKKNVTNDYLNTCVTSMSNKQAINIGNITATDGAKVDIKLSQLQMGTLVSNFLATYDISTVILQKIATITGIKIQNNTSTTAQNSTSAAATQKVVQRGIGSALAEPINAIGNAFNKVITGPFIDVGIIIGCVLAVILIIIIIFVLLKKKSSGNPNGNMNGYYDNNNVTNGNSNSNDINYVKTTAPSTLSVSATSPLQTQTTN